MKGDICAPAFRLLHSLPVRTHIRAEPESKSEAAKRRRAYAGSGGHNAQPVLVRGQEFSSVSQARKKFKIGKKTIERMIALGEARYIGEDE